MVWLPGTPFMFNILLNVLIIYAFKELTIFGKRYIKAWREKLQEDELNKIKQQNKNKKNRAR